MIRKQGNKYVLLTHDGKRVLGTFSSRKAAEKREQEIKYFKNKRSKKNENSKNRSGY